MKSDYLRSVFNLQLETCNLSGNSFLWKQAVQSITLVLLRVDGTMEASDEIRKKLATLIGHLISRCIHDARMIPTVLHREEIINLLVDDPALFQKLVGEEHAGNSELSKEDLTVKVDAVAELGKLDNLEAFDKDFWGDSEVDLSPILELTNQLTRTFAVYMGNASTLFDKTFEGFMDKFRQSLQRAGMTLKTFDFDLDDVAVFENRAAAYLLSGEFLQAFTFDRLLSSQIMMKQLVNMPTTGFLLREKLIRRGLENPKISPALVRFVLRVSYISQNAWDDLFPVLAGSVSEKTGRISSEQLVDFIEQDVVFSCNLLCRSYAEIRLLPSAERKLAIKNNLKRYEGRIGTT
jgi:hypothetical protein